MYHFTTMRVKRLHFFFLVGFIFLLWNFVTFYTLTSRGRPLIPDELLDKSKEVRFLEEQLLREKELTSKLDRLQQEMGQQMQDNKLLLQNLMKLKQMAVETVDGQGGTNAGAGTKEAAAGEKPKEGVKSGDSVDNRLAASPEEHIPKGDKWDIIPILMIACDRVTVKRSLEKLIEYRPSAQRYPIVVSQDCGHKQTSDVIQEFVKSANVTHIKQPDLANINLPWPQKKFVGYYKIARHYKWALDQVFVTFNFSTVVIVEDDLDISPDFYEYFSATLPILRRDPTLWCVSAWNDNGKDSMVSSEAELLYRTDFFPGLGWMIERKTWMELRSSWPETFWDDWMRHPEQRKGRECIRPEICRTSTFGKKGVSKGLFFEKHLKYIKLNTAFVPFNKIDLSYLEKAKYDEMFTKKVYSAPLLTAAEAKDGQRPGEAVVRVEYTNKDSFKKHAKMLGIMDDFKAGVPRAAYRGVVSFVLKGRRVFLAPPSSWTGYDTSWS